MRALRFLLRLVIAYISSFVTRLTVAEAVLDKQAGVLVIPYHLRGKRFIHRVSYNMKYMDDYDGADTTGVNIYLKRDA